MEKFIIDTNFFFNLEIKSGFGSNPKEVISGFVALAKQAKQEKKADFFMPPKILDEFFTFVSRDEAYVKDFLSVVTVKSPHIATIQFEASVFYMLVEEMRERSYKGLRIADEAVQQAAEKMHGTQSLSKIEYQKTVGEVVTKLRERYRQATRYNFLDSVADLDLIVLAKELDGILVTSDDGVLRWGRLFGVKEIPAGELRGRLSQLL